MSDEIDPDYKKEIEDLVLGGGEASDTGLRKLCMNAKRCVFLTTCENAQHRNKSVNMVNMKEGNSADGTDCANYTPRLELGSTLDVPRRQIQKKTGIRSKHNLHAPDREVARKQLMAKLLSGKIDPKTLLSPNKGKTKP